VVERTAMALALGLPTDRANVRDLLDGYLLNDRDVFNHLLLAVDLLLLGGHLDVGVDRLDDRLHDRDRLGDADGCGNDSLGDLYLIGLDHRVVNLDRPLNDLSDGALDNLRDGALDELRDRTLDNLGRTGHVHELLDLDDLGHVLGGTRDQSGALNGLGDDHGGSDNMGGDNMGRGNIGGDNMGRGNMGGGGNVGWLNLDLSVGDLVDGSTLSEGRKSGLNNGGSDRSRGGGGQILAENPTDGDRRTAGKDLAVDVLALLQTLSTLLDNINFALLVDNFLDIVIRELCADPFLDGLLLSICLALAALIGVLSLGAVLLLLGTVLVDIGADLSGRALGEAVRILLGGLAREASLRFGVSLTLLERAGPATIATLGRRIVLELLLLADTGRLLLALLLGSILALALGLLGLLSAVTFLLVGKLLVHHRIVVFLLTALLGAGNGLLFRLGLRGVTLLLLRTRNGLLLRFGFGSRTVALGNSTTGLLGRGLLCLILGVILDHRLAPVLHGGSGLHHLAGLDLNMIGPSVTALLENFNITLVVPLRVVAN
jgi:hypothetical protein